MKAMRKRATIAIAAVVGTLLLVVACGGGGEAPSQTPEVSVSVITPSGNTTPRARRTATPSPTPTGTPLEVCAPNPDPAPPSLLQIIEPAAGEQVRIPVHVRGWSSAFAPGSTVSLAIVDERQNAIQVNHLQPQPRDYRIAPPGLDINDNAYPFAADLLLNDVTAPTPYCLWAYLNVTEEGRARQVVQVPVIFLPRN
jgi:hypothetical protein